MQCSKCGNSQVIIKNSNPANTYVRIVLLNQLKKKLLKQLKRKNCWIKEIKF